MSLPRFQSLYTTRKVTTRSKDLGKVFVVRRGCNVRTATYTEEFLWEDVYKGAGDVESLIAKIKAETKATRSKRKRQGTDTNYEDQPGRDAPEEESTSTPCKRRKLDSTPKSSPKSRYFTTPQKLLTPTHKRQAPNDARVDLNS